MLDYLVNHHEDAGRRVQHVQEMQDHCEHADIFLIMLMLCVCSRLLRPH